MKNFFIPFDNFVQCVGGPSTFMAHLKTFLDDYGISYSNEPNKAKAIFFPISYDLKFLKKFKKKGGRIIQRLDGIYYPSKHGESYISLNKDIKEIHNNLADFVIYQSKYSQIQCETMFGKLDNAESLIILNGTDKSVFYSKNDVWNSSEEIRFISTGNFRNPDMIEPIIKAFEQLNLKTPFKLVTIGPIADENIRHFFEHPFVEHKDSMEKSSIADELRKSDVFIYSHLNPPCPNSVVEAVSCGLPVVGFNSGAMEELLYFNRELLADVSGEVFQKYEDFDPARLAEKISLVVNEFSYFKQRAMDHSYLYPFEETGKRYVKVFNSLLEPSWWEKIIPDRWFS